MSCVDLLLDSWDRQGAMVDSLLVRIDDGNRKFLPSADGMSIEEQFAHMHSTRRFFLSDVRPDLFAAVGSSYVDAERSAVVSLEDLKKRLKESHSAVRRAVAEGLDQGGHALKGENVTYDNPVLFLQHMIWHEGWHVGLVMLALRLNGQEPPEEWEEEQLWGRWRTEVW